MVEMQEGSYRGWEHMDADLMSLHLFCHPKARLAKQGNQPMWLSLKDVSKQFCHAFTYGKFPSPCKSGRIHKCCKCSSLDHGAKSCPKSDKDGSRMLQVSALHYSAGSQVLEEFSDSSFS